MASYDVASKICLALLFGGDERGAVRLEAHADLARHSPETGYHGGVYGAAGGGADGGGG